MADTIPSQYMSMPVPIPTVAPGPQFAEDLNSCLTIVDQHTHAPGAGTPVTPAGLNINADLSFGSNNATALRSARFTVQGTPISGGSDLSCAYSAGSDGDFYFNDQNGNQIRLTQAGSIAGTPGSITGLVPPASITYTPGTQTYAFYSSTATAGNLDAGSVTIREVAANANGITLSSPAALPANYTLTFMSALPSSATKFMRVDGSGNISANTGVDDVTIELSANNLQVKNNSITPSKLAPVSSSAVAAVGQLALSSTPSSFSGNNTVGVWTDIPDVFCTLATHGNPVNIGLLNNTASSAGSVGITHNTGTCAIAFFRNDTLINYNLLQTNVLYTGSSFACFDTNLPSSAYTYSLKYNSNASTNDFNNICIYAKEL